jgi:hypothetical protein
MTRRFLKCAVLFAGLLACQGSKGDKGDKGDPGDQGPQGNFTGTFNGPATFNGESTFNGNATVNGRVGAGVAAADSRLHVAGTGTNAGSGSVSASAGTTALSGVGTSFTGEVTVGSIVATTGSCSGTGQARLVASVGDNVTLDVSVPWTVNVINCTFNVTRPTAKVGMDANTTDFIVNGQGQVGIGAAKLDVRGNISSTNIGVFCGVTATAYTGAQVGGYTGAKAKCEVACKHPNAHMCTTHEYIISQQLGINAPTGGAWISGMYDGSGSTPGDDDCDSWTAGPTEYAGVWGFATGGGQDLNFAACTSSYRLACCL